MCLNFVDGADDEAADGDEQHADEDYEEQLEAAAVNFLRRAIHNLEVVCLCMHMLCAACSRACVSVDGMARDGVEWDGAAWDGMPWHTVGCGTDGMGGRTMMVQPHRPH